MPGLIGIVDPQGVERDLLERMASALKLEDWYSVNLYCDEIVGLGRVSLGKLNPEQQPIFNEDRSLCICMEGELYNYAEIKQSLIDSGHRFLVNNEPELVLHLYEECGLDFAEKLNGAFVAAIWDFAKRRLAVVNDRLGLRPLYYAHNNQRLLFASLANVLLTDPAVEREIDPIAVGEFFSFEYVLDERTFLTAIKLLPPASLLIWQDADIQIRSYWQLAFADAHVVEDEETYTEKLISHLRQAAARQSHCDGPSGVLLSGGLDSRIILALLTERKTQLPIQAFTFGMPDCDDARLAREVAKIVGVSHCFLKLRPDYLSQLCAEGVRLTDGMMNCVHMQVLGTLDLVVERIDFVYKGFMGDALMGAHLNRDLWAGYCEDDLAQLLFQRTNVLFSPKQQAALFSEEFYQQVADGPLVSFKQTLSTAGENSVANKQNHFDLLQRQRRFILNGVELARSRLVVRTPFCDNDLVSFMLKTPPGWRLDRYLVVKAFARTFRDLAKVPYEGTGLPLVPCLRDTLIRLDRTLRWKMQSMGWKWAPAPRQKRCADYDEWMRTTLKNYVMDILLDQRTLKRGYFNPSYIRNLVKEHMDGIGDYSHQIGAILTFELWNRMFIDHQA